jgi:hypothetical protein
MQLGQATQQPDPASGGCMRATRRSTFIRDLAGDSREDLREHEGGDAPVPIRSEEQAPPGVAQPIGDPAGAEEGVRRSLHPERACETAVGSQSEPGYTSRPIRSPVWPKCAW